MSVESTLQGRHVGAGPRVAGREKGREEASVMGQGDRPKLQLGSWAFR